MAVHTAHTPPIPARKHVQPLILNPTLATHQPGAVIGSSCAVLRWRFDFVAGQGKDTGDGDVLRMESRGRYCRKRHVGRMAKDTIEATIQSDLKPVIFYICMDMQ
mmetsp:Transcript_20272/g.43746  ORF Transcript_20272/g.43746 Transcript_20272/m.43746 type:complete len:105 (+) Transcript_20272:108-422(+)